MGKDIHIAEEISAYLDGEVEPDGRARIEAHLRACPECVQRYQELRAVTSQVRSLRAPEVRPEFVTRVLARVREEAEQPMPWWQRVLRGLPARQWTPSLMIVCTTLVFMTAITFASYRLRDAVTQETMASAPLGAAVPGAAPEPFAAANVIDELVGAGVDTEVLAEYAESDGTEALAGDAPVDFEANDVIDAEFLAMLDAGWSGGGDDVYGSIDDLTAEEQSELQVLLQGGYYDTQGYEGLAQ